MFKKDLREAGCGKGVLGGDVDGWAGKTVGWGKLGGKEEGEEELCFACAAEWREYQLEM